MDILLEILAILLGVTGLLGCILPVLPGPPLSYIGMVLLYFWGTETRDDLTGRVMVVWLILTIAVTVLDYVVPAYFTRITGGSKAAARASMVGMMIGLLFFPPMGMIAGAFLGALAAEMLVAGKKLKQSLKPALGSFIGFLVGTGFKLIASGVMLYYIIAGVC